MAQETVNARGQDVETPTPVVHAESQDPTLSATNQSIISQDRQPQRLEWTNLCYEVDIKNGTKEILQNINGFATPGRLLAIIGPSGAGKTSLLNVLAGRIRPGGNKRITGDVSVNGSVIRPTDFRSQIAYVMQEDAHVACQTPREALRFSAALRLSEKVSEEQREALVDELIKDLMLTKCADTLIGGERIQGISGGERKRTSVAQELITRPNIIFLDEPTSGLDSYAAYVAIRMLKKLAQQKNMTVICTIHQPSSEIFNEFDDVCLLGEGQTVYHGPVQEIVAHFESLGKPCPKNFNPADHVMFEIQTAGEEETAAIYDAWKKEDGRTRESIVAGRKSTKSVPIEIRSKKNFFTQFYYVFGREFADFYRNKIAIIIRCFITAFLMTFVGLIFLGVGRGDDPSKAQAHFGAITNICISAMFSSAQPTLLTFPIARSVFVRDYQSGTYGSVAWILAKTMCQLPMLIIAQTIAIGILKPLIGLQGNFFWLVLTTVCLGWNAESLALFLGTLGGDAASAIEFSPILFVPQILFAGFFIPIPFIPYPLRWIRFTCFLKYGINLMSIVEFEGLSYEDQILKDQDITTDDWWWCTIVFLSLPTFFRILSTFTVSRAARNVK